MYCVYEHVFPNGKRYFGITKQLPERRWRNGDGYTLKHQPVMYNAINKYGWNNIEHNILYTNLSKEEACDIEKRMIYEYSTNCHKGKKGYNMTDGGEGNANRYVSDETKLKMRNMKLGKTGALCPNSKPVICNGKEYVSVYDFSKIFGLNRATVQEWLKGNKAMPVYWFNLGLSYKYEKNNILCQKKPHSNKFEYNGILFNSQAKLAEYIGVTPSCLCLWLRNGKFPEEYKGKIHRI